VAHLDSETIERLRQFSPRQAYLEVKSAIYAGGASSSEDFVEAFDQLVEAGVLSWEEIEELEKD